MIDVNFPIIEYQAGHTQRQWGQMHGEVWREAIKELIEIRTGLMREKNAGLTAAVIADLAAKQWEVNAKYDAQATEELIGIAQGARVPQNEIVILNNYTDFRDIQVPDQGCSAIYVLRNGHRIAGQTWDMHGSAKRFVCCLKIPAHQGRPASVVFSIVGCIGMMGYAENGQMAGVNNLNTTGARPGALWPTVIRKLIHARDLSEQQQLLQQAPLTSGRSFLLASRQGGEFWEVGPDFAERVSQLDESATGHLFHTNHCLGTAARQRETRQAMTSTTHTRFELIEKKISAVDDFASAWELLNDHEGYPRSICSNYQTNSQDPSITCGGAVGDLQSGTVRMWRGDQLHDKNFIEHHFQF